MHGGLKEGGLCPTLVVVFYLAILQENGSNSVNMSPEIPIVTMVACVVAFVLIASCVVVIAICLHKKRLKKRSLTLSKDIRLEDKNVFPSSDGKYLVEPYSSVASYGNNGLYASVDIINHLSTFQGKYDPPKNESTIKFQDDCKLSIEGEMVSNVVYESYKGERNSVVTLTSEDASKERIDGTYQTIESPRDTDRIYDTSKYTSEEGFEDNVIYEPYTQSES